MVRLLIASVVVAGLAIALLILTRSPGPRDVEPVAPMVSPRRPEASPAPAPAPPIDAWVSTAESLAARSERERLLEKIRDAHAGTESWNDQGLALLDQIARVALTVAEEGCYMAGCFATFIFESDDAYRRARETITASPEYARWTGGKQFTSPEVLGDGRVVVAAVFQRPD